MRGNRLVPARRRIGPSNVRDDDLEFPSSEIQGQLARILESPEFMASEAQRAFLHCMVTRTPAGQQMYEEIPNFERPNLFWTHLIKAATLGRLGRIAEGRKAAAELLRLKPDSADSGLRFIG